MEQTEGNSEIVYAIAKWVSVIETFKFISPRINERFYFDCYYINKKYPPYNGETQIIETRKKHPLNRINTI